MRERTGRGQHVRTSLLQGVMALQSGSVVDYPGLERVYRETPTYRIYQAQDGEWLFLAVGNQSFFRKLCQAIGRPEMADDPRFGSWLARRDNGAELMTLLEETFASKPRRGMAAYPRRARHPCRRHADDARLHAGPGGAAPQDGRAVTSIPSSARSR